VGAGLASAFVWAMLDLSDAIRHHGDATGGRAADASAPAPPAVRPPGAGPLD
jgi:hypothetical protein